MTAKLTFDDEFNSLSLWNGNSGTWSTTTAFVDPNGNGSSLPSNGEQEWYINANYAPTSSVKPWTVNNGVLTLTAQKVDPSIQQYLGYNQSGLPAMGSYQYTSGLIETNHSFNQTYGYFEMKAQLPAGQGLWPAFWLMPSNGAWPPELDVMEALGKDTTTAYASVHTNETGSHTSEGGIVNVGNTSDWHTYAVDWEADKITFYYDNKQVYQVDTPADMHGPMYMIANLAMGGGWAGSADGSTPFPADMNIDYIRAYDSNPYTNGGAIPDGGSAAPTTPTTGSDQASTGGGQQPSTGGGQQPSMDVGQQPSMDGGTMAAPVSGGTVQGTSAADTISGGADGGNHLYGGAGDDQVVGGNLADVMNGNTGADTLQGGAGADVVNGGKDNDAVYGNAGADTVNGNVGADTVGGGQGADLVRGGQGDDSINGGAGNDHLWGDRGNDILTGGAGADTFHFYSGSGTSTVTDFNYADGDRVHVDDGAQFTVTQSGENVVIDLSGGGEMILQHTQLSSLPDGWIS